MAAHTGAPAKLRVTAAVAAHDRDINAVAVAPNDSGAVCIGLCRLSVLGCLLARVHFGPDNQFLHMCVLQSCALAARTGRPRFGSCPT